MFTGAFGLSLVYRTRHLWDGDMQRYMDIIATGAAIHVVVFVPATVWILNGAPTWFGIAQGSWFVLFHGASLLGLTLIARGVYLLWANEIHQS